MNVPTERELLLDALLTDHGAAGPYEAFRRLRETRPRLGYAIGGAGIESLRRLRGGAPRPQTRQGRRVAGLRLVRDP